MPSNRGYPLSIIDSGNPGFSANLNAGETNVKTGINAVKTLLKAHGWTDDSPIGTAAQTALLAIAPPYHNVSGDVGNGGDGFEQVPSNSYSMGIFDGIAFILWDSFSTAGGPHGHGAEDPTGTSYTPDGTHFFPVIGVALGLSAAGTLANFATAATANTRWAFAFGALSGGFYPGTATANSIGTVGNVDASDPDFSWAPAASTLTGQRPRLGGWNLVSTAAPVTGDIFYLWVYEDDLFNMAFLAKINTKNGSRDCPSHPMNWLKYYAYASPYQFSLNAIPTTVDSSNTPPGNDTAGSRGGGNYYLLSALYVPDAFQQVVLNIDQVVCTTGQPVEVYTTSDHTLSPGEIVDIDTSGVTELNANPWYVKDLISARGFTLTTRPDYAAYTHVTAMAGGGHVTTGGITHAAFVAGQGTIRNSPYIARAKVYCLVNGTFKTDWAETTPGYLSLHIPIILVGTPGQAGQTGALKVVSHAPLISINAERDNTPTILVPGKDTNNNTLASDSPNFKASLKEARIVGYLWDAFVGLRVESLGDRNEENESFIVWMEDTNVLRIGESALWLRGTVQ